MTLNDRQRELDAALLSFRDLWHPQPFREIRPSWCDQWPALLDELLNLPEVDVQRLNDDCASALDLLARHIPAVADIARLAMLPARPAGILPRRPINWAWEIPGRKQSQIEAFAAVARGSGLPVLDWCGGKGHLGRLLALAWEVPVQTLEIEPGLCVAGTDLAVRAKVNQTFVVADALRAADWPRATQHAVALHACGDLHRHLIRDGVKKGVGHFDIAPCCYYRGVAETYQPLSSELQLVLSRDDTRLAVTETVTSAPRETRRRDMAIAWKLGFDAYRRTFSGDTYRPFKPVPDTWLRAEFADFLMRMAGREGLPSPTAGAATGFEKEGWQRRDEMMRLSIVRHAFRRALEVWLALDLSCYLQGHGYLVELGSFCERPLTPRNLLISARSA